MTLHCLKNKIKIEKGEKIKIKYQYLEYLMITVLSMFQPFFLFLTFQTMSASAKQLRNPINVRSNSHLPDICRYNTNDRLK